MRSPSQQPQPLCRPGPHRDLENCNPDPGNQIFPHPSPLLMVLCIPAALPSVLLRMLRRPAAHRASYSVILQNRGIWCQLPASTVLLALLSAGQGEMSLSPQGSSMSCRGGWHSLGITFSFLSVASPSLAVQVYPNLSLQFPQMCLLGKGSKVLLIHQWLGCAEYLLIVS